MSHWPGSLDERISGGLVSLVSVVLQVPDEVSKTGTRWQQETRNQGASPPEGNVNVEFQRGSKRRIDALPCPRPLSDAADSAQKAQTGQGAFLCLV